MIDDMGRSGSNMTRVSIFGFLIFAALIGLIARLWYIQVIGSDTFAVMAEGNRIRTMMIDAPRGRIFDRYGRLIVGNKLSLAVYVMPAECDDKDKLKKNLAAVLGTTDAEIDSCLNDKKYSEYFPKLIDGDVGVTAVTKIKEHPNDFPGVFIEARPNRYYPYGSLAAHELGYVGQITEDELKTIRYRDYSAQDTIGKSGLEYQYDLYLQGIKGAEYMEVNASGVPLRTLQKIEPKPGADLYLTIDLNIQQKAEKALAGAIERARAGVDKHAEAGAIVVLDAKNSEVIAMASYPTFDPSIFVGGISSDNWRFLNDPVNLEPLQPRAYASSYPPGSSFKPIVGLGAISEQIITPHTAFSCSGRWYGFGASWSKACWKKTGHGRIVFDQAIIQSCDIAFYNIGLLFYKQPGEKLQDWARSMGLGKPTGIDLPSEDPGRIPDKAWKKQFYAQSPKQAAWVPGDTVNMAIGQGDVLVTPLQLANVYATIANGGTVKQPRIMANIKETEFQAGKLGKEQISGTIPTTPESLSSIKDALARVTTEGTARGSFWDFPIPVAGKTGTAQVSGKDDQAWFAAYAPAADPKYVVLATIEQGGHGSTTAAPAVKEVLAELLNIELDENLMYKAEFGQVIQGGGD